MGKTLIIAEKPSVGRDLADVLPGTFKKHDNFLESDEWVITWAVGHLVELAEPDDYDEKLKKWRKADLPIIPGQKGIEGFKLRPRDGDSGKQLKAIHRLAARDDVDRVINACDAGREGELIFAYTMDLAPVKKPVDRLWISSMTKKAITEGFENLRPGEEMQNLEASARSRSEADWLVGMNATRAATIKARSAFGGVVSLGRVQTPTLGILAARERAIKAFEPETYFLLTAHIELADKSGRKYDGLWFDPTKPANDKRATWLSTSDSAKEKIDLIKGNDGVIESLDIKKQNERAPLLYDLTSLQREANRKFGFTARRTLAAAQSLYERHKVLTYPRTNSRYLSTDMVPELKTRMSHLSSIGEYSDSVAYVMQLNELPLERIVNDDKVEDHHAIIPTEQTPDFSKFSGDDQRIYDMVVRRFIAAFHPIAKWELTTIISEIVGERFRTKGRVLVVPGWKAVYGITGTQSNAQQEDSEAPADERDDLQLPKVEQNEKITCADAEFEEKQTKPPARYTEGTLLSAMETAGKLVDDEAMREAMKESGLGTPATRAQIIELLVNRQYIQREGKDLRVTTKGMKLIEILDGHPLTSPELTGGWEKQLRDIEHGTFTHSKFLKEIVEFTQGTVEQILEIDGDKLKMQRVVLGPCPRCAAAGREELIRENARAYGCTSWKSREETGCGFVIWRTVAGRQIMPEEAKELLEARETSQELQGFRSRAGKPFRAKLRLNDEDKVEFVFAEPRKGAPSKGKEATGEGADGAKKATKKSASAKTAAKKTGAAKAKPKAGSKAKSGESGASAKKTPAKKVTSKKKEAEKTTA